MSDRVIVYDGALFQTTDILNTNKFAMIANAFQNAAMLGTSTVVAGLSCVPTGPASLQVVVNEGSIYQLDNADASAYGDLGTDSNNIMKQGILYAPKTLTITPPSTSGFSQVFLVEAELQDIDSGSTVLSYFNSTPPNVPFSGPANSGTSQNTIRTCVCTISLKAGTAATTGTQVTPAPDAGFIGLFAITVPNGATSITSGNIVQLASAPFFPTLPAIPSNVQGSTWTAFSDTGSADALVITPSPAPSAWAAGLFFIVKKTAAANATTSPTLNITGSAGTLLGAKSIVDRRGNALAVGDLPANAELTLLYDGTSVRNLGIVSADIGSQKSPFNTVEFVSTARTAYGPVTGFSTALATGTYNKKSTTSKLCLRMSTNLYTGGASAEMAVMRVTFNSVNYEAITHVSTASLSSPAPNAEFQISGLSSGAFTYSISFGRYDATAWTSVVNPTQAADAAYLPVFTPTTVVFTEVEP